MHSSRACARAIPAGLRREAYESAPVSHPTVSVLIPCHNAEKYVGETIDSVLRQTWPAIEMIVVDDGSKDRSATEIERFQIAGVRLIRQENRGAGHRPVNYRKTGKSGGPGKKHVPF